MMSSACDGGIAPEHLAGQRAHLDDEAAARGVVREVQLAVLRGELRDALPGGVDLGEQLSGRTESNVMTTPGSAAGGRNLS